LEIHQLEYFVANIESSGFSWAAERYNEAQISLSQQIRKFENEIGQPLIDRFGRKVVLTDIGRMLLPRARTRLESYKV
jgi:DNA-binding transcriptional LysR family regulator